MTPLQLAQQEWENKTTPHPKNHREGKKIYIQEFRKFEQAIAWLGWDGRRVEIKKLEKLPRASRRAGTVLLQFLKSLADKYQVRLFGNATIYEPDPPIPDGPLLSQEQLEAWYKKHGFKLRKIPKSEIVEIRYPNAAPLGSDIYQ